MGATQAVFGEAGPAQVRVRPTVAGQVAAAVRLLVAGWVRSVSLLGPSVLDK